MHVVWYFQAETHRERDWKKENVGSAFTPECSPLLGVMFRVRKSKNFPDSKIFVAKTFRIKCVNRVNFQNIAKGTMDPRVEFCLPK